MRQGALRGKADPKSPKSETLSYAIHMEFICNSYSPNYAFFLRTTRNCRRTPYIHFMNRRQFTTRLAALFAAPALPVSALATASAAPVAAPVVITTGATSWASYLMAMHDTCTPTMLKSVLNINADSANAIHSQMVKKGVITDGNRIIRDVKQRLKSHLEAPDMSGTRPATIEDLDALADIWHDGWFEAHAEYVPNELTDLRDRPSLRIRMEAMLSDTDVVGPIGAPIGFCTVLEDEIYQFYVAPAGRGTGTANALMKSGEQRIKAAGFETAMLYVIPENPRAQAFYRRNGWDGDVIEAVPLQTLGEPYMLPCLILTKRLK